MFNPGLLILLSRNIRSDFSPLKTPNEVVKDCVDKALEYKGSVPREMDFLRTEASATAERVGKPLTRSQNHALDTAEKSVLVRALSTTENSIARYAAEGTVYATDSSIADANTIYSRLGKTPSDGMLSYFDSLKKQARTNHIENQLCDIEKFAKIGNFRAVDSLCGSIVKLQKEYQIGLGTNQEQRLAVSKKQALHNGIGVSLAEARQYANDGEPDKAYKCIERAFDLSKKAKVILTPEQQKEVQIVRGILTKPPQGT